MTLTIAAKWETHSVRRGVIIRRRLAGTGTACGQWYAAGTYFQTLGKACEYIDSLPIGYFAGPNQTVNP